MLDGVDLDTIAQHYPAGVRERHLAERVPEGESYFPELDKWLYFTAAPIRDRQGRIVAAMESSQDITERKRAEQALAENETRLQHMLDSSPVPLFVIDRNPVSYTHLRRAGRAGLPVFQPGLSGTADLGALQSGIVEQPQQQNPRRRPLFRLHLAHLSP